MDKEIAIMDEENIKNKIYTIRGLKVMLDRDLAELYEVLTKNLNKAVKRNIERFPEDFMFQLTEEEFNSLRSQNVTLDQEPLRFQIGTLDDESNLRFQIGTSRLNYGGRRYLPFVFTEQGVATLSGVLKSKKAIEVNIQIMRAFIAMRKYFSQNKNSLLDSDFVYRKLIEHDNKFEKVFNAIEDNTLIKKQGIFFDGQMFDAHKFVSDLIKSAKKSIVLIDNYVDDSVLTLFSERKKEVEVVIYTKEISKKLKLDLEKFNSQYEPVEIKEFKKSHDRFLIIDEELYHFGASLKDLGRKWFAFSKFDRDVLGLLNELKK